MRVDTGRTRTDILSGARKLCHEVGFEQITMSKIATQVGCSRATVYNHYSDRNELLDALCTQYLEGFATIQDHVRDAVTPDQSVFDVLRDTIAEELRWRVANADLRSALDAAKAMRKDFYLIGNQRIDEAMLAWFGAIYEAAAHAGLLRDGLNVQSATRSIYAMVDHEVANFSVHTTPQDVDRTSNQLALLAWYALFAINPSEAPRFSTLALTTPGPEPLFSVTTKTGSREH